MQISNPVVRPATNERRPASAYLVPLVAYIFIAIYGFAGAKAGLSDETT